MSSLPINLEAFFSDAKSMVDYLRDSQFGTWVDIIMIVATIGLAVFMFWNHASAKG